MSTILLIRSVGDLLDAVEDVNEFLVHRRQLVTESHEADEILGIWLRRELDTDLPAWLMLEPAIESGKSREGRVGQRFGPGEASLGIRESVSISQLWALCNIDGTLLSTADGATGRRRTILDHFVRARSTSHSSGDKAIFFAVFTATETGLSVKSTVRELQDSYPNIVGRTWFIDDPESGLSAAPWEDDA